VSDREDRQPGDASGPGDGVHPSTHPPRREAPPWLRAENPFSMFVRTVDSFRPRSIPAMARHSYRRELVAGLFLPWLIGLTEGGVLGVIVKKYFEGSVEGQVLNYAVAAVTAAPAFANVTSFVWARLTHGKHKVRSVNVLQIAVAALVALMAAAPRSAAGLALVVGCAIAARVCLAGVVTLRAVVWRNNYAKPIRARLTSRIVTVVTFVLAAVGAVVGVVMDRDPGLFRVLFPVGAVASCAGIWSWSKIRLRGHRRLLKSEQENDGNDRPSFNPLRMGRLLIDDKRYGFYMLCQFLIGVGNLMLIPVIVVVAADVFGLDYFRSMLITHVIPILMMPVFITQWAKLLDRWHISTYRAVHSWFFVAMALLIFGSVWWDAVWMLYAAVVVRGIAFAGGALAWNLGHNDFARDDNAAQYMAVHVTLTGIRGLAASFIGIAVYEKLEFLEPGAGAWVFAIGGAVVAVGAVGFYLQHRVFRAERLAGEAAGEEAPGTGQ
jgi:hypothetical protein